MLNFDHYILNFSLYGQTDDSDLLHREYIYLVQTSLSTFIKLENSASFHLKRTTF